MAFKCVKSFNNVHASIFQGPAGSHGERGREGPQGPIGLRGSDGAVGPVGQMVKN